MLCDCECVSQYVYTIAILIQSTYNNIEGNNSNNSIAFMKLYKNRCITNTFAATTHYSSSCLKVIWSLPHKSLFIFAMSVSLDLT